MVVLHYRVMSEPDPRLLERLFPGPMGPNDPLGPNGPLGPNKSPRNSLVENRRNLAAAASAGGSSAGSNKVGACYIFALLGQTQGDIA